jgi:hypothetical protein
MKTRNHQRNHPLTLIVSAVVLAFLGLLTPTAVNAQWTTADGSGNINNTNSNNVGVGTTSPNYKFDITTALDRAQIRFGLGAGDSGGFLYSNGPAHAVFSAGASFNGTSWIAKSLSASMIENNLGALNFYTNPALSTGSAFTPTVRMSVTSGGRVGIGTTAPSFPLSVIAPSGTREGIQVAGSGNTWVYTDLALTPIGTIPTGKPANFVWSLRKDAFYGGDNSGPSMVLEIGRQDGGTYVPFIINPSGNVILAGATNATNGNVGVGTTAPAYKLDVAGQVNSTGGLCLSGDCKTAWSQIGSQWTGSSTVFYNGNVGVGTTAAPSRRLEVVGGNVFHQWSTTAGSEYGFYTAINSNHFTSNLYYDGQWKMIGTGKSSVIATQQSIGQAFGVYSDNTSRAANSVSTLTQLMGITMDGRMGIGTNAPDAFAKLHLYGSGGFGQDIQTTTADWARFRLVTPARTWGMFVDGGTAGLGSGKMGFFDYTANAWRMVFDTAGKIGLGGNTAPARTLDVTGDINASTGLCIAGDCKTAWSAVASQWANGSGSINYAGGSVGIGISSPLYSLDVNGGVNSFRAKAATVSSSDSIAVFENSGGVKVIVRGNGNVGIGTTAPTKPLDVVGDINASGTITGGNIVAKYQDLAEWVESSQELAAGTVVILDPSKANQVVAATQAYDSRVAGVISLRPGIALGEQAEGRVLVASTGRVKVKVDASAGPINIGDLLVTSDKPGVAMKSVPVEVAGGVRMHRPGTLIGKALEPLAGGTGEILVLLSLQ